MLSSAEVCPGPCWPCDVSGRTAMNRLGTWRASSGMGPSGTSGVRSGGETGLNLSNPTSRCASVRGGLCLPSGGGGRGVRFLSGTSSEVAATVLGAEAPVSRFSFRLWLCFRFSCLNSSSDSVGTSSTGETFSLSSFSVGSDLTSWMKALSSSDLVFCDSAR